MNRMDMAEEIAHRVPLLSERYADEWKAIESERSHFVSDYPPTRISKLKVDEYVIGLGRSNLSFCYRLERKLDSLGRILGSTAFKFGVYYGHTKSDRKDKYRFAKRWGRDPNTAFLAVKKAIVDLLASADSNDWDSVRDNPLSPMLKGKLLTIYHPDQFAAIFSPDHLKYFIAELDLPGQYDSPPAMQRALMEYRNQWPDLKSAPFGLYMRFLYDLFGAPKKPDSEGAKTPTTPILADAIIGATLIEVLPIAPSPKPSGNREPRKSSIKRQRQYKRIGDRGEKIVLALERQRLMEAGRPRLADKIDPIADRDDSAGFDIMSYETDGSERPIEVKSTTAPDTRLGFFISANEIDQSKQHPNYYIYFVFSAMTASPRVYCLKKPDLFAPPFASKPISYHVTMIACYSTGRKP